MRQVARWSTITPSRRRLVMWGAADQARVNQPILAAMGCEIAALVDDTPGLPSPFVGVPVLRGWEGLSGWLRAEDPASLGFVIAIGNPYGHVRCALHDRLAGAGLTPVSLADDSSLISASATCDTGLQVMPRAIIHHYAAIGRQCIINTGALVEHDCRLEDGVEIGPGAVLCGRVHVGRHTWIGAGATIRPRIRIGANSIVGAGAVVVADVPDGVIAVGVPARAIPGAVPPSVTTHSTLASS